MRPADTSDALSAHGHLTGRRRAPRAALAIGALGVVFGDIGTSPLYAFRESLTTRTSVGVSHDDVLGVLSLMLWSLVVVITVKYVLVVMRADNHGEGGILALAALITGRGRRRVLLMLLGLFGTALLYGDGMITPAISVLSAVEGVEIAAPSVHRWIVPATMLILIGLFALQRYGTDVVGRLFGPVMLVWFGMLGLLGSVSIAREPAVLAAVDPSQAVRFLVDNGVDGVLVLGSVFLVVTGGEALYADMGHFGRHPIRLGWFAVVFPALILNYLGQGALLLRDPSAVANPFFLLAPRVLLWPLTILATGATIIASQALISGAFSLTMQAVNLGYLPRLRILQTSTSRRGQVYVPAINWMLLGACLTLVVVFGSSSRLAAAYGVAVTLTMLITTVLIGVVARQSWGWPIWKIAAVVVPFALIDTAFVTANLFKIPAGGWVPLVVGAAGFTLFTTWSTGRRLVNERLERRGLTLDRFLTDLRRQPPHRHPGTGVYLGRTPGRIPPGLLVNLRHNESLHASVVVLSVTTDNHAHVSPPQRAHFVKHPLGFHELEMRYGFTDRSRLYDDLTSLVIDGLAFDADRTTYFLGRERVYPTRRPGMALWRDRLFAVLHRNAADPSMHFGLPPDRCVDIGAHIDI